MANGRKRSTRNTKLPDDPALEASPSSLDRCLASADIMLHVQDSLGPLDIISLRKTSKSLNTLSKHRIVWLHAVVNVCASEGLPVHWFPLESMSILDLEHLALSPSRFLRYMQKNANKTICPARTQSFVPKNPFSQNESLKIEQMYLLPGGRFFLTNSLKGMCLWDLGYNSTQPAKCRPIAWHPLSSHSYLEEPQPAADGKGVTLFCTPKHPQAEQKFTVYEIYPASPQPEFVQKAAIRVGEIDEWNPHEDSCGMVGHFIIFQTSVGGDPERYMLNVWDWINQMGCKWETSGPTNFALIGNTVMALEVHSDELYQLVVFDLPAMQPIVNGWSDVMVSDNSPKLVLNRRHPTSTEFGIFQAFSWLASTSCICLLDGGNARFNPVDTEPTKAENLYAELYRLKPLLPNNDDTLPTRVPVYQGSCQNFLGSNWNGNLPKHPSTTLLWSGQNNIFIRSTPHLDSVRKLAITAIPAPASSSRGGALSSTTVFLNPANCDLGPDFMTTCPATGRFVILARNSFNSATLELRVADLLLPRGCL